MRDRMYYHIGEVFFADTEQEEEVGYAEWRELGGVVMVHLYNGYEVVAVKVPTSAQAIEIALAWAREKSYYAEIE